MYIISKIDFHLADLEDINTKDSLNFVGSLEGLKKSLKAPANRNVIRIVGLSRIHASFWSPAPLARYRVRIRIKMNFSISLFKFTDSRSRDPPLPTRGPTATTQQRYSKNNDQKRKKKKQAPSCWQGHPRQCHSGKVSKWGIYLSLSFPPSPSSNVRLYMAKHFQMANTLFRQSTVSSEFYNVTGRD